MCHVPVSFFFWNFSFFWTVRGVKGQRNGPRWQKKIVWSTSYLRNHVSYDCHLWYIMQNDDISRFLFHFFKIWILWVVRGRGVKGQKMKKWSKMRKKFYLAPYLRNHTLYDFHLCYSYLKWQYLQEFFSLFQNFDFPCCWWGKRAKSSLK